MSASYLFDFILLIKDVGPVGMILMIKSLSGTYTAMSAPLQNTNTPRPNPACCKSPDPFLLLPLLACPSKLCISAVGGKHYTGLAQVSVSLNISSWLPSRHPLHGRVSSSTFIRTSAEGEARGRKRASFFITERKTKKTTKRQKMCQDLLMFYSVNQRCYLTQVPYVISITLMIPKITKDFFFSLHGLCEWCFKMLCVLSPPPSCLLFLFLSSPVSAPPTCTQPMHPCYACSCFICALITAP